MAVFAATLYGTVPFPLPLVAPVSVIQAAFETADHVQPVPAVTPTFPVAPLEPTDCPVELIDGAQAGVNEKPFDTVLPFVPPGPIALTRASKTTLGVGTLCRSGKEVDPDDAAARRGLAEVHGVERDRRSDDEHRERVPLHERRAVRGKRVVIG